MMKSNYNFLNTSIGANSLFIKGMARSFISLNAILENKNKSFTNIWKFFLRSWSQNMVYVTMIS